MKTIAVVCLAALAAVASAAELHSMEEEGVAQMDLKLAEDELHAASPMVDLHEQLQAIPVEDMPVTFSVYASPSILRDGPIAQEQASVRSVYDKPFFAALRVPGKNEMAAFLLKDGLGSLTSVDHVEQSAAAPSAMPTSMLRDAIASGSARIGIMLSAAHYLRLPEMDMPIVKMVVPLNFTLADVFAMSQDYPSLPWMYMANKEDLPPGVLDKLIQVGQFSVSNDKLEVTHDYLPATTPSAPVQPAVPVPNFSMRTATVYPIVYYSRPAVRREEEEEEEEVLFHRPDAATSATTSPMLYRLLHRTHPLAFHHRTHPLAVHQRILVPSSFRFRSQATAVPAVRRIPVTIALP